MVETIPLSISLMVTMVAAGGAAAGIYFTGLENTRRLIIPFASGLLGGMAVFGVLPELIELRGAAGGAAFLTGGFVVLAVVNRSLFPMCPACAKTHDHAACQVRLHGFAVPLVGAALLHSFMDGVAIGTAWDPATQRLLWGIPAAIGIHKIPEGLAYGTILRSALATRRAAIGWSVVAQIPTILGAASELLAAETMGHGWLAYPLAIAGGSFLFLGYHGAQAELQRSGKVMTFGSALAGAAGAAFVQHGLGLLHH